MSLSSVTRQEPFLRRVAANGGWWLAERFALLALTLVSSIVIVRSLGPTQYGELSYVSPSWACSHRSRSSASVASSRARCSRSQGTMRPCFGQRCSCDSRMCGRLRDRPRLVGFFRGAASGALGRPGIAGGSVRGFPPGGRIWFRVQFKAAALVPWRTGVAVLAALLKMAVAVATHDPVAVACVFALEYLLAGGASLLALRRASGAWRAGPFAAMAAGLPSGRPGCSHRVLPR